MQISMSMKPGVKIGRLLVLCWATAAQAESVDVKYYGPVDLTPFFTCSDVTRSSFIEGFAATKPIST
jgi:hypothetical protein